MIKNPKEINSVFHFGEFARIYQSFNKMNECINSNKPTDDIMYRHILDVVHGGISHKDFVEQLDKSDAVLARYEFFNMFPTSIGAIDLSYETVDALETFDVEFQYSHWNRVI